MKLIFAALMLIHGLIHIAGFSKAFNYGGTKQLTTPISKNAGALWMLATLLFIIASVLFYMKKEYWWMMGTVAAAFSQLVIIMSWKDAKFGTIANVLIVLETHRYALMAKAQEKI